MDSNKTYEWAYRAMYGWALLALVACSSERSAPGKAFHVVVISMDGVLPSEATPNLQQFAKTSTGFVDQVAAQGSPLAIASTLLTGLTAAEHGAGTGPTNDSPLSPEQTPLPEYLVDHGYQTGTVISSGCGMPPESGLNQGFGEYLTIPGSATDLAVLAEDWIEGHRRQPFFLFVQFPVGSAEPIEETSSQADEGLGILLRKLAADGLLDASLVVVTGNHGETRMLRIKGPGQRAALSDPRQVLPEHMPQLLLRHMALPVAAVRPNSYFSYPLEPNTAEVAKDGNP
jgi:arylsulfatase A-like enzyme